MDSKRHNPVPLRRQEQPRPTQIVLHRSGPPRRSFRLEHIPAMHVDGRVNGFAKAQLSACCNGRSHAYRYTNFPLALRTGQRSRRNALRRRTASAPVRLLQCKLIDRQCPLAVQRVALEAAALVIKVRSRSAAPSTRAITWSTLYIAAVNTRAATAGRAMDRRPSHDPRRAPRTEEQGGTMLGTNAATTVGASAMVVILSLCSGTLGRPQELSTARRTSWMGR